MINLKALIFSAFGVFGPLNTHAAVFGDANSRNGVEDQRLAATETNIWPREFKSVGRIYCAGSVQGSAILFKQVKADSKPAPRLLTAKHVIEDFDIASCTYAPQRDTWRRADMISIVAMGLPEKSLSVQANSGGCNSVVDKSIASRYEQDWIVIELSPWNGWQSYAIRVNAMGFGIGDFSEFAGRQAYMVGFDVLSNRVKAHPGCHFGLSDQSNLLNGRSKLYWDDCDSTEGGSGGALFVDADGGYELLGFRVGSLFDELIVGDNPEMGAAFDINANINVTRAISREIFESVSISAEKGCEPVGNNDSLIENQ